MSFMKNLFKLPVEIGSVIYQKTSDEIQMSLEGDIQAINEHEEPWLVEDIDVSRETLKIYNLKNGRKYKMYFKEFYYLVNHDRIRLSNEVA